VVTNLRSGLWFWILAAALVLAHHARPSEAQSTAITPSGGLGTSIAPPASGVYRITGGTLSGSNLFHSFGSFSVGAPDTAQFLNTTGGAPKNIVGRVTGLSRSDIYGTIDTLSIAGANFFLINPAGVVFGPSAKLKVDGAVRVSTADYLRFDGGGQFFATLAHDPPVLSVASPIAFGFLSSSPAPIEIRGSNLQARGSNLQPLTGKTLSLVGGDIAIAGGTTLPTLGAPSGRVEVVSVGSSGEVRFDPPSLDVTSFAKLGRIDLSHGALLDAGNNLGNPGGSVVIRAGNLFAKEGASIRAFTLGGANGAQPAIDIQVSGDVVLNGGANIQSAATQVGNGGDVRITAGSLQMDTGASINSTVGAVGRGRGGDVVVSTRQLTLKGGARISSTTGAGPGGNLDINATDAVVIDGTPSGLFSSTTSRTASGVGGAITIGSIAAPTVTLTNGAAIATTSGAGSAAPGGDVDVHATSVSLAGGAQIISQTTNAQGGNVTVTAAGPVTLSGPGTGISSLGGQRAAGASASAGPAGDITVQAAGLVVMNDARIQNGTLLNNGGSITITANGPIVLTSGGRIANLARSRDVGQVTISAGHLTMDEGLIQTSTIEAGRAGDITIRVTGDVTLTGGAQIATSSGENATGGGGNLTLTAASVSIVGTSPTGESKSRFLDVPGFSNDSSSGLFSTAHLAGPAGQIAVSAPRLVVANGGKISVSTTGNVRAPAGDIHLSVGQLNVAEGGRIDSSTSGAGHGGTITVAANGVLLDTGGSMTSNASSAGLGGDIVIRASNIQLSNGATISATSTGIGNAGSLTLAATGGVRLDHSVVTTDARVADGGNIILNGGSLVYLLGSRVTTSVESGKGGGGNITIDPQSVILDHSVVRADAFGGPGGNVRIGGDIFLTNDSLVSASSALGTPGTINIEATVTNVSGTLARLPEAIGQAATLLRASCAARFASGKTSSLVIAGRQGVPVEPGDLLAGPLLAGGVADTPSQSQEHIMEGMPRMAAAPGVSPCGR
jgi:filamentous hemagglutinin family protein